MSRFPGKNDGKDDPLAAALREWRVRKAPEEALSDGYQSLTPESFEKLINKLSQLAPIVDKELKL